MRRPSVVAPEARVTIQIGMPTNRDLYQLVTGFKTDRSLEEYLRAMWALGTASYGEMIDANGVCEILTRAVTADAPPFQEAWRARFSTPPKPSGEFVVDWECTILFQITELRAMAEDGTLESKYRYFGVVSPSGGSWYNFDVVTYLECGVRGTVGGFEADEVVVLVPDPDGDDDSAIFELADFGWEAFTDLLWCGQYYE